MEEETHPGCYIIGGVLVLVLLVYLLLEIHYFIRMGICVFIGRFFKKKINILDTTHVRGGFPNQSRHTKQSSNTLQQVSILYKSAGFCRGPEHRDATSVLFGI
uniref:Uncharacterized protein n=1 Tax=Timema shepardi TaxID=629360 RepID=A0A7R9FWH7_TIMSH|nr:unnamed protein product [Timema shepardi]